MFQTHNKAWLLKEEYIADVLKKLTRAWDDSFNPSEQPEDVAVDTNYQTLGGVAVIQIHGVIMPKANRIEKMFGFIGCDDIGNLVEKAVVDPAILSIVLHINSPGGSVTAVPELAQKIADARRVKPVFTYIDEMCASAAYWLAAGSSAIYAVGSSTVGSIGVYLPVLDVSEAYKQMGAKMVVIKSGILKAAGLEGTTLSQEQYDHFQQQINYIHNKFKQFVRANRGNIADANMEGQDFFAEQAVSIKLVDSITSFDQTVTDALNWHKYY